MKHLKFVNHILIFTLSLAVAVQGHAAISCADLFKSELTDTQTKALLHAKAGDYEVGLMSGVINGKKRTVVFLGETHVKAVSAKQAGQAVVKEFNFRGLEGANIGATWGGRFLSWTVDVAYALGKVTSFGKRNQTSTIDDANRTELLQQAAAQLAGLVKEGKISKDDLASISITIGEEKLSVQQLISEFGLDGNGSSAASQVTNVPLEAGHKPGLAENLQSILLPATMLSCAGAVCAVALEYAVPGNAVSGTLQNVSLGVLAINGTQFYGSKILGRWFKDRNWYKYVFSIRTGLLDGRNRTMVENIKSAFQENEDQGPLLVIVGRAHVEGMKELLKAQLGFTERPITP